MKRTVHNWITELACITGTDPDDWEVVRVPGRSVAVSYGNWPGRGYKARLDPDAMVAVFDESSERLRPCDLGDVLDAMAELVKGGK